MNDYDFNVLNDKEFEKLCIDLIGRYENTLIERFKSGKDQGIDGRFYSHSINTVIIQAKHYVGSGLNALMSKLRNEEVAKVKKLDPQRYILLTSVGLSPKNKNEIMSLFYPYIKSTTDIYGREGVNDLIDKFPETEIKYYKLWISSSNVLINILNNGIIQKSQFLIKTAQNELAKYIKTKQFDLSLEILKEKHALVITGLPGVGKTTLAKQLALYYFSNDYEVYHIEDSISEAESCFSSDKRQFFYFDDFLGANYLDVIVGNHDSKIMNFIKRVMLDSNKKIVLTSRSNILNRAKGISDAFNFGNIEQREIEINVTDLTEIEKADILYNHIWHSSLVEEFTSTFYENKNYWSIIKHKNFNPRLISIITDGDKLKGMSCLEYWPYVQNSLNNPEVIWELYFKRQISEEVFDLVNLVVFNGGVIEEKDCKTAMKNVFHLKYPSEHFKKIRQIDDFIKESIKSTLNRNVYINNNSSKTVLVPFNPSISDYIINRLSEDDTSLSLYFGSLETISSINTLFFLFNNEKIKSSILKIVTTRLIKKSRINGGHAYTMRFCHSIINSKLAEREKIEIFPFDFFATIIKSTYSYGNEVGECMLWAIEKRKDLFNSDFGFDFIEYALSSNEFTPLYHEDYLPLTKLALIFPDMMLDYNYMKLKEIVIECLKDGFDEILGDSSKIKNLTPDEFDSADDIAFELLNDVLSAYPFEFTDNEAEYIFDGVDTSQHLPDYSYFDKHNNERYSPISSNNIDSDTYINDLFSRD